MKVATPANAIRKDIDASSGLAWWRYPILWLVVGGPAVVVVASMFTAVLAVRGADPVLAHDENGGAAATTTRNSGDALTPALQARNHAASPKP